jgi:hypothetical protein
MVSECLPSTSGSSSQFVVETTTVEKNRPGSRIPRRRAVNRRTDRSAFRPAPKELALAAARIQQENVDHLNMEEDFTRLDRRGGPRLLLLAIVKNAVNTLEEWSRRYDDATGRPVEHNVLRADARAAYGYLISENRQFVTSFLRACEETDADPQAIRDRVLKRMNPLALEQLAR